MAANGTELTGVVPRRDMVAHSGRAGQRHNVRCSDELGRHFSLDHLAKSRHSKPAEPIIYGRHPTCHILDPQPAPRFAPPHTLLSWTSREKSPRSEPTTASRMAESTPCTCRKATTALFLLKASATQWSCCDRSASRATSPQSTALLPAASQARRRSSSTVGPVTFSQAEHANIKTTKTQTTRFIGAQSLGRPTRT